MHLCCYEPSLHCSCLHGGRSTLDSSPVLAGPCKSLVWWCLQGASMSSLREWAQTSKQTQRVAADKQTWAWVVQGGCPADPHNTSGQKSRNASSHTATGSTGSTSSSYATLYCTGHSDGAVRLWDMHGQVPKLLGTVPSSAAAHALSSIRKTKAAAACTLEFAWEQGLLISGHEGGEVSTTQLQTGSCASGPCHGLVGVHHCDEALE